MTLDQLKEFVKNEKELARNMMTDSKKVKETDGYYLGKWTSYIVFEEFLNRLDPQEITVKVGTPSGAYINYNRLKDHL